MAVYKGNEAICNIGFGAPVIIEGIDTSDATISSSDMIPEGEIAYGIDGKKIVGTAIIQPSTQESTAVADDENNTLNISVPLGYYNEPMGGGERPSNS